jgi:hypothetical protein
MELRDMLMASPGEPEVHHYPPTTADWVTSPIQDHDELEQNPLEPAPKVKPGARLGAVLIIASGILAVASLIVQLYLANVISRLGSTSVRTTDGITLVFPIVTMIFPLVFAVGGVVRGITLRAHVSRRSVVQVLQFASTGLFLQLLTIPLAVLQIVAPGSRSGQTIGDVLGPANWLTWASFLIMLAAAWFIRSVVKPPATQEDIDDEARYRSLVDRGSSAPDFFRKRTQAGGRIL